MSTLQRQQTQIVTVVETSDEDLRAENAALKQALAEARHQIMLLLGNGQAQQILDYNGLAQKLQKIGPAYPTYNLVYLAFDQAKVARLQQQYSFAGLQSQVRDALSEIRAVDPIGQTKDSFIAIIPAKHAERLMIRLVDRLGAIGIQTYATHQQCTSADLGVALMPVIAEIEARLRGQVDRHAAPVAKQGRGAVVRGKSIE